MCNPLWLAMFQNEGQYQSPNQQNYENIQRQQLQQPLSPREFLEPVVAFQTSPVNEPVQYNVPNASPRPVPAAHTSFLSLASPPSKSGPSDSDTAPPLVVHLDNVPSMDNSYYGDEYLNTQYMCMNPEKAADIRMENADGESAKLLCDGGGGGEPGKMVSDDSSGPLLTVNLPLEDEESDEQEEYSQTTYMVYDRPKVTGAPQAENLDTTVVHVPDIASEEDEDEEDNYLASHLIIDESICDPPQDNKSPLHIGWDDSREIDQYSQMAVRESSPQKHDSSA